MKLTVKGVNLSVTPSLGRYVDEKLIRAVEKLIGGGVHEAAVLDIELIRNTGHHKKGAVWTAAANLRLPQKVIWQKCDADEMHSAIDGLEDILKREVKKYKERSRSRELRGSRRAKKTLHLDRSARFYRKGRIRQEGV